MLKSTFNRIGEMNRVLVLIHIAVLLISCTNSSNSDDYIRYNASNNITSLDPAHASNQDNIWAVAQLYNGLVQLDSNLEPQPSISSSWEIKDSGSTFIFHLRKDVRFHSDKCFGKDLTRMVNAWDFKFSFERIMDPETASPGAWIFNDKIADSGFIAPNDSTFIIKLKAPFAPFVSLLSMPYCSVIPFEAIDFYDSEFAQHPVGTGPFKFKLWEEDVKLLLDRNPNYFEKLNGVQLPLSSGLVISFIVNKQMALLNFIKGHLDFYNGVHSSIKDELLTREGKLQKKYANQFSLEKGPVLNTEYLAINISDLNQNTPFSSIQFRRGLNHAINREKMISFLRNNVGTAANGGFIPIRLPGNGHDDNIGYTYDKQRAKQLVDSSGYNGREIVLNTTKDYLDLSVFIQQEFKEVGVVCKIEVLPSSRLKEEKMHGKLGFFRASWIADYPDAENYLSCFYSKNFSPNGPNYTRFSSQKFDELYDKSLQTNAIENRLELYKTMDSLILDACPIIVLFYDQSMRLTSKRLKGLPVNALNIPWFKYARLEN